MPELFNGTVVTTLSGDDRLAAGKPGIAGAKNITFANLVASIVANPPTVQTFTKTDLNSGDNYSLIIAHGQDTENLDVVLYNNEKKQIETSNIFEIIDSDNVKFTFNAGIEGTWKYILIFY